MKVILICARGYFPLDGGDRLMSYGLLKALHAASDLMLVNFTTDAIDQKTVNELLRPYCRELYILHDRQRPSIFALLNSYLRRQPFYISRRTNVSARKGFINDLIVRENPDVIVWDHMRASTYFVANNASNVLLEHNDEGAIYEKRIEKHSALLRWLLSWQVKWQRCREHAVHAQMQRILYLNKSDIRNPFIEKKNFLEFIAPEFNAVPQTVTNGEKVKLLFVGSLEWFPNRNGIVWFVNQVMPLLPARFELKIVGRNPDEQLLSIIAADKRITVSANVPAVAPYYAASDIFISPVTEGSGINIKILEAAAFAIPMVVTPFSKKGYPPMDFIPEASTAEAFAAALVAMDYPKRQVVQAALKAWYDRYNQLKLEHIVTAFLGTPLLKPKVSKENNHE